MIAVEHLTKCYGSLTAVDDLSFTIGEGHVYGFLGPNGAGKSTTMNIMTGCLSATAGSVKIDGFDIFDQPQQAKRRIGYLPEHPPLYLSETPQEYLTFVGEAKGLRRDELRRQIDEVVALTRIEGVRHRPIATLSKGYRQRVGIAQALLGDPGVIILDEPTVGLDPIQIIEIRELIRELGKTHTVIFSSHILSEVQAICDEILMIAHGKLVAFDTPQALEKTLLSAHELCLTTDASPAELATILQNVDHITALESERGERWTTARLQTDCADVYELSRQVFLAFAGSGRVIVEMTLKKGTLEDVFLELSEASAPAAEPTEPAEEVSDKREEASA